MIRHLQRAKTDQKNLETCNVSFTIFFCFRGSRQFASTPKENNVAKTSYLNAAGASTGSDIIAEGNASDCKAAFLSHQLNIRSESDSKAFFHPQIQSPN